MDQFRRAPILPNITLRPDQVELVNEALRIKRGVVKAPTRTGKTIIQYAIVSAYTGANTLFLAHTKDLVNQLADEGERFGFNVARFVGDRKDFDWAEKDQIVVMTRQSCANLIKRKHPISEYFNMIIIDEAHHVTSPDGQYAKILTHIKAPLRYGFTATMPDNAESSLSLEGYVGPLVGELTIKEAIDKDILVKPKMLIKKAPHSRIPIQTKYSDVYDRGIVNNLNRNKMIAEVAKEYVDNGSSVLILVNKILHGSNVEEQLREISVPAYYVQGETETAVRDWVKRNLIAKRIMCVIATTVWKEGINIPSLNVCINAGGGKSEISTLQSVGRSLTKTEGKDHAVIVDLFDPSHHYLISHFGERVILYTDQGWM
jgi:superfamily II DNA or RNA helicase